MADTEISPDTAPASGGKLAGARVVQCEPGEAPIVVTGSREQLFHLLAEASEIEHCLMCSYLFAAFSLKRGDAAGLSAKEGVAVGRWRKAIMGVAIEEMGHLLILANLTTAIGGTPHFSRPNFPVAPGYFPAGVVARLSAFSLETLKHFIFLERPKGALDEEADDYAQAQYSRRQPYLGLMPNAQHYSTIGFLYEAISENLVRLSEAMGEDGLFLAPGARQLVPPLANLPGVERIDTLKAALAGIDLIVEQGEGSASDRDSTHYRTFLGIRDEYRGLMDENPDFAPAWPVADNPVLRSPPEPHDKVFVDHPDAAPLLDFTCATYGLLLRLLAQCFGDETHLTPARQETLFNAALELMHVMGVCASALPLLPACVDLPDLRAGMSFTMLRGLEPFLPGATGDHLLTEQFDKLVEAAATIPHVSEESRSQLRAVRL